MVTPNLFTARTHYCDYRNCDECRLSSRVNPDAKGQLPGAACTDCDDAELLRRFGNEIEVVHNVPAQTGIESVFAPKAEDDPVNHPTHYTHGGIECIDAIEAALSSQTDPVAAFLTGQSLKYLWRWPIKNGLEDLRKARWYLDRLIKRMEGAK
jgi:hypothetical protein